MEVIFQNIPEALRTTWTLWSSEYEPIDEERPPSISKLCIVFIAISLIIVVTGWLLLIVGYEHEGIEIMVTVTLIWAFYLLLNCLYWKGYFSCFRRICCCCSRTDEIQTPENSISPFTVLPPSIPVPQASSSSCPVPQTQSHSFPKSNSSSLRSTMPHSLPPSISFLEKVYLSHSLPESESAFHSCTDSVSLSQSLMEPASLPRSIPKTAASPASLPRSIPKVSVSHKPASPIHSLIESASQPLPELSSQPQSPTESGSFHTVSEATSLRSLQESTSLPSSLFESTSQSFHDSTSLTQSLPEPASIADSAQNSTSYSF